MNSNDAFVVADFLTQLARNTYLKEMTTKQYVKMRSSIIKRLTQ